MVCISLQLAEKPSAAGVLNDQEGRSVGSAHGQGEHSARAPKLQNDAVGFRAHGVVEKGWRSSVIAWSAAIHRATVADAKIRSGANLGKDTHLRSRLLHLDVRHSQQSDCDV
jgi:hypothetical protein